jgi:hypothetical protein
MRWLVVVAAGCAARPPRATCGSVHVDVPASLAILEHRPGRLLAASPDVALYIGRDTRRSERFVIEYASDFHLRFRYAFRRERGCTIAAIANFPATSDGDAITHAIAGSDAPFWLLGSSRVPSRPAVETLRYELGL